MADRILKFPLWRTDEYPSEIRFNVPLGSVALSAAEQDGRICLWMRCPVGQEQTLCRAHAIWTGDHLDPTVNYRHVGTVLASNALVWHIFVEPSEPVPSAR